MKKHKVKKAGKLYHPEFTPFQKVYIKMQRGISFLCAPAGSDRPFACVSGPVRLDHRRQRIPGAFCAETSSKIETGRYIYVFPNL